MHHVLDVLDGRKVSRAVIARPPRASSVIRTHDNACGYASDDSSYDHLIIRPQRSGLRVEMEGASARGRAQQGSTWCQRSTLQPPVNPAQSCASTVPPRRDGYAAADADRGSTRSKAAAVSRKRAAPHRPSQETWPSMGGVKSQVTRKLSDGQAAINARLALAASPGDQCGRR